MIGGTRGFSGNLADHLQLLVLAPTGNLVYGGQQDALVIIEVLLAGARLACRLAHRGQLIGAHQLALACGRVFASQESAVCRIG